MQEIFRVTVNENLTYELNSEDITKVDALRVKDNWYHILQDNRPFRVEIISSDFNKKKYHIKVNNTSYTVDIADGSDFLIKEMGFTLASVKSIGSIMAPMPGLILEISVKEGQEVIEGDQLLILEAMKMENIISSPRDGVIKKIAITKGEAIEKKHLLIEFE
ncbi:MAG: acetyl-CoA carboxylase biotin carboxyl carrier protein subunit [Flavobacteriaceae bacterium]